MKRVVAGLVGAAALAASALTATPAQAAGSVTLTAPSCGTLRIANTGTVEMVVTLDSGDEYTVAANTTRTFQGFGGVYYWISGPVAQEWDGRVNTLNVPPCSGQIPRPAEGDQNGDRMADVLGITAATGDLYYYRMTSTRLASGVKAGTGWKNMIYMQQVNELEGEGTGNTLLAVRNDGTVWQYNNGGYGKFWGGRQIGSGFTGYDNFAVTQLNNPLYFGAHLLLARKGDMLMAFMYDLDGLTLLGEVSPGWTNASKTIAVRDFNGDNAGELVTIRTDGTMHDHVVAPGDSVEAFLAPRQVGSGWGAMQTVTSPGSLNADRYSDLIARRSDGNLYKYINAGNRWGSAQQIGVNWQGIRLLA